MDKRSPHVHNAESRNNNTLPCNIVNIYSKQLLYPYGGIISTILRVHASRLALPRSERSGILPGTFLACKVYIFVNMYAANVLFIRMRIHNACSSHFLKHKNVEKVCKTFRING
ncbi:hypothetical protein POVWA2_018530 [Plasmodium ovale wallikeri]|uniref:Uncharacterized protein n=1 Tax=Plasmodium ovale wallikeri TaxID=864142 RepID=A0A1A8YQE2_PLAOA|nr:hypothetical protein POVWA1_018640 [Plasmodium ovale wallikeri]SBT34152.1 hypothetical protein POVWA2_018530 [Plasmodium ovale wallikeri]